MDPKKIKIPSVRVTSVWDPDEYEVFKSSLEADGIASPIICVKEGETWWLADGKHRLDEAKLKGWRRVDVAFKEGTLLDAKLRNLYLNRLRGKTKASEEVILIKDLYENDKLDLAEIAKRTGMSPERIDQRLAISKADPYVRDMLDNEKIGIGVAFQLSRIPYEASQVKLLTEIVKQPITPSTAWVRDVVDGTLDIIKKMKEAPAEPTHTIPIATILCGHCGERYEVREMRGVNLCRTCDGVGKDYIKELIRKRKRSATPEEALARQLAEKPEAKDEADL